MSLNLFFMPSTSSCSSNKFTIETQKEKTLKKERRENKLRVNDASMWGTHFEEISLSLFDNFMQFKKIFVQSSRISADKWWI